MSGFSSFSEFEALERWWRERAPVATDEHDQARIAALIPYGDAGAVVAAREFWATVHRLCSFPLPPRPLTEIAFMAGAAWQRAQETKK